MAIIRLRQIKVDRVVKILEPDHRGLSEVLYLSGGDPMTAWLDGGTFAYIEDGW